MQRDLTKKLLWGLSFLATILAIGALGLMIFVQVGLTTMGSPSSQARLSDYILPYAGLAVTALLLVYLWNRFTLRGTRSIARKIALSGVLIVFLLLCLGYFDRFLFSVSFLAPIAVWTHLLFYNTLRRFFIWIMAVGYLYFIWNSADSRRQAGVAVRLFQAGVIIVGVGMGLQGPSHSRPGIGDLAVYSNSEGNETVLKNNEAIVDKQAEVVLKSFLEYYAQHESLSVVDVGFTRSLDTTETLLDADYLQVRLGAGFDAFCEVHAQCQLLGYRSVPNAALYNIPTLVDSSGSWLELTIVPQGGKVTRSQNRVSFVGKKLIVKRCSKNPPPRRTYDNTCGIATVPFPGVSGEKTLGPAIAHWKY